MPARAGKPLGPLREGRGPLILLAILLLLAAALRWNNLDWDQGHVFHPDERHILMVTVGLALPFPPDWSLLLSPESPLNPHSFAYGSLPFYLLKLTAHLLASLGNLSPSLAPLQALSDFEHLRLVGRFLSGLFDLGSVVLIYLIGRRLYDRRVGLLGAALLAVTVINIQYSHFYASDTLVTFFILAATLSSMEVLRTGRLRPAVFAGIAAGLAVGSKFSAAPIFAVVVGAHLLRLFLEEPADAAAGWPHLRPRVPPVAEVNRAAGTLLASLLVAVLVFVIVEPYAIIDFNTFTRNLVEQNDMVRGIADLPYTRQYANTPPYWYFIWNLAMWGMGLPLGLVALLGSAGAVLKTALRPRKVELLLLLWVLPYFAITGSFHAKFLRYLLPLTPFICLLAAYGLFLLRDHLGRRGIEREPRERDADFEAAAGEQVGGEEGQPGLHQWPRPGRAAVNVVMAIALLGGLLYALAFSNIYAQEHTAVRASEWIYQHVPKGSRLMTEHWEEGLPVPLVIDGTFYDAGRAGYDMLTFGGYEPDNPAKFAQIEQQLNSTDYILFFSNRLYSTIPRLPQRYPITTKYYQLLFGEQLGFRLEAYFTAYPSLFGVTLEDDTFGDPGLPVPAALAAFRPTPLTIVGGKADESFSVYDHPKVLVFKKVQSLSDAQLRALFGTALSQVPQEPGAPVIIPTEAKPLLLSEAQRAADAAGGTFRELFDRGDFANRQPVTVWVALMALLGLLGLPLAFAVFRRLPDRGYPLARPLAILVLAWLDWMSVSLGLLRNTRQTAALALLLLALSSAFFAWRQWHALAADWRARWRQILVGEGVIWAAFALFLAIRMANPDLWHPARGGEKPMDLAYLMAAIKSATFPPYDPWFAGGYLNYYYYGQIVVATLIKLSGILPTTAYNLVVPLLFALTAGGAFSAAYNLVIPKSAGAPDRASPARVALIAGIGAALVAVVFGNLGGALQIVDQVSHLGPPPLHSSLPGVEGLSMFLAGLWRMFFEHRGLSIPTDWYWASTRVLEGTINEFPFFTFLYADLHAHMIALPFTLLAVGLAIDLIKGHKGAGAGSAPIAGSGGTGSMTGRAGEAEPTGDEIPAQARPPKAIAGGAPDDAGAEWPAESPPIRTAGEVALPNPAAAILAAFSPEMVLRVLATGLIVGALTPTNSWDFPTYLALYGASLLLVWYLSRPLTWQGLGMVVLKALGVAALSYALYWPFHSNFQQWYLGVEPIKDKSDVWGYFEIHGLFLFAILSFLVTETGRRYGRASLLRVTGLWARRWERLPRVVALQRRLVKHDDGSALFAAYGIAAVLVALVLVNLMGMALVAILLGLLVWTALLALHRDNPPERLFTMVLVAGGLALSALVEVVAIKGDIGRMNTVFKFYMQVWILWSVAAIACLYFAQQQIRRRWSRGYREGWALLLAVLVTASLVYPLVATRARVNDRYDNSVPPTLDGTAYMATATFQEQNPDTKQAQEIRLGSDLPAMRWLQDNVPGSPVILEGWVPLYQWGARYSIYTGLPTVIGWDWHQKQQRWGYQIEVDRRVADVRTIYNDQNPERAVALLDKYRVQYVVVGDLERAVYSAAGLAKFDQMVGRYLELVYDNQGVKIYRRL